MIGHLHVGRTCQPIEHLLLVIDIAIVVDVLALAEVCQTRRIAITVFLGHQFIVHLHNINAIFGSLVVDQFDMSQYTWRVRIILFV